MKKLLALVLAVSFMASSLTGCGSKPQEDTNSSSENSSVSESSETSEVSEESGDLVFDHTMELKYAQNFKVDYFKDGYKLLTVDDHKNYSKKILLVPEGKEVPENSAYVDENTYVYTENLNNLLVSSTPVTSLINAVGGLDAVKMTTYDADSWYIENVKEAIQNGSIKFIGHYKEPDFEAITADLPQLAIYSTMILSAPEVESKLTELGVKTIVDQSTYEPHPMARSEWMKFYGALLGKEEEAQKKFDEQCEIFESVENTEEKETAVIFYVSSKNVLYARKGGDYMAKMLELAGGEYVFSDVESDSTGTIKMDFESFYEAAKDAENIIYIWSTGGKPKDIEEFTAKNELFKDLKAVQTGNVWCTTADYFQVTNEMGVMISEINKMLTIDDGDDSGLKYLFRLK